MGLQYFRIQDGPDVGAGLVNAHRDDWASK